jgi:excisionase family DNA binding protein
MDEILTLSELTAKLKVPKSWLYKRTMKKKIPGQIKLGKHLRFKGAAIKAWIEKGCPEIAGRSNI